MSHPARKHTPKRSAIASRRLAAKAVAGESRESEQVRAAARPSTPGDEERPVVVRRKSSRVAEVSEVSYDRREGVYGFVRRIRRASPMVLVETERSGVRSVLIKDLASEMEIPATRFYSILGVPKATVESKASRDETVTGAGGQAALGVVRLLGIAQEIVGRSTAPGAREFDVARWLGQWLQRPQPAIGGRRPADLLDTPTGFEIVARTLGALESGSYL